MIQANTSSLDQPTNATRRIFHCVILIVYFVIGLTGCQSFGKHESDVKIIYERSAQYHMPDRNPVIVIPGILGSKLIDRGSRRTVWGAFDPESADPTASEGARLISLPVEGNRPLSELRDGVEPNGVLDKVHVNLFGIPLDIRAYVGILTTLGAGGYRDEALGLHAIDYGDDHFTCFQFDYDWRRDNVENAKRLKQFIEAKRAYVQQAYKKRYGIEKASVKFDIVAHSMGSLVARYFLMYGDADLPEQSQDAVVTWAGADYVDRLILVGPPNAGSINALTQLIEGFDVGRPILPYYQAALLGTFPALYELLPRPRHGAIVWDGDKSAPALNLYDPALWDRYEWGLASREERNVSFLRSVLPDAAHDKERRRVALALQTTILGRTKAFTRRWTSRPTCRPGSTCFSSPEMRWTRPSGRRSIVRPASSKLPNMERGMAPYCAQARFLMNESKASGAQGWSRRSIGHLFSFCSRIIWGSPRMRHLPTTSCTGCWKIRDLEEPRVAAVSAVRPACQESENSGRKARLLPVGSYGVIYQIRQKNCM